MCVRGCVLPLYAQAHGGAGEHSERRYMLVWPLLFGSTAPNILSRLHGEEWRGEEGVCARVYVRVCRRRVLLLWPRCYALHTHTHTHTHTRCKTHTTCTHALTLIQTLIAIFV